MHAHDARCLPVIHHTSTIRPRNRLKLGFHRTSVVMSAGRAGRTQRIPRWLQRALTRQEMWESWSASVDRRQRVGDVLAHHCFLDENASSAASRSNEEDMHELRAGLSGSVHFVVLGLWLQCANGCSGHSIDACWSGLKGTVVLCWIGLFRLSRAPWF